MKLSRSPQSDQDSDIPWIISEFKQVEYYLSLIKMSLMDKSTGRKMTSGIISTFCGNIIWMRVFSS